MRNCQNCGWSQELCGEHDCHFSEPKTKENGECSGWKPGLEIFEKAWEIAHEELSPMIKCGMDYAMKQAIKGS
jgi:hypothetical protein